MISFCDLSFGPKAIVYGISVYECRLKNGLHSVWNYVNVILFIVCNSRRKNTCNIACICKWKFSTQQFILFRCDRSTFAIFYLVVYFLFHFLIHICTLFTSYFYLSRLIYLSIIFFSFVLIMSFGLASFSAIRAQVCVCVFVQHAVEI